MRNGKVKENNNRVQFFEENDMLFSIPDFYYFPKLVSDFEIDNIAE